MQNSSSPAPSSGTLHLESSSPTTSPPSRPSYSTSPSPSWSRAPKPVLAPYLQGQNMHSGKEKDIQIMVGNGDDAGGRLAEGNQSTIGVMEDAASKKAERPQPSQSIHETMLPTAGRKRPLTESDEVSSTSVKRRAAGWCCPYRIKNPRRFNVRKHHACATQVWTDLAQLKRHIATQHAPPTCRRCEARFDNDDALEIHSKVDSDQVCSPGSALAAAVDAEDGISPKTAILLKSRKSVGKIDSWGSLWRLLFPQDTVVPANRLEPIVELQEVLPSLRLFLTTMSMNLRLWGLDASEQLREEIRNRHETIWEVILDVDQLLPYLNAARLNPVASNGLGMLHAAERPAPVEGGDYHERGHWEKMIPDLILFPADVQLPVATLSGLEEPGQPATTSLEADNHRVIQPSQGLSEVPDDSVIDPSLR